jgi:ABC-type branched-subunit amino acid transport system permease subunit
MLDRLAPPDSAQRRVLVWGGLLALTLLYTQVYLVGDKAPGRGTPFAILFQGLLIGLMNALTAAGIILVYRSSRIINFAQTAIGLIALVWVLQMVAYNPGFPFLLTLVIGLAAAGGVGAGIELGFGRRFQRAPRLVFTVATITGATLISLLATDYVTRLPFFPPVKDRLATDTDIGRIQRLLPFPGFKFHVGSLPLSFGFPEILAIWLAVASLAMLAIFFKLKQGIAVKAASQNSERAALLGISVGGLSTIVWALAGVLSAMNLIADGLMADPTGLSRGTTALLAPLAAAVLARLTSLPTAVSVSVLIGVAASATEYTYTDSQPIIAVGLFVVICAGLLLQRRGLFRTSQSDEESSWQATAEPRPVPKELRNVPTLRIARYSFAGVALLFLGLLPFMVATRIQNLLAVIALFTIVGLSLVVLTGWAGQVSLGQFGFVAVGSAIAGSLSANAGWSFWLAVPVGTIAAAAVAALIGLPALRIRGLYLAVATFAFASAVAALFASSRYLAPHLPRVVARPTLFFINFDDERSMYFLCVAALLVSLLVVLNLRRSRFGRLLIASRENEANVQSFGVSLVRLKVLAFVVSGAIAGFAGSIYAFQQRSVNGLGYGIDRSFAVFIDTVLGGVSSAAGAFLGSGFGNLTTYFLRSNLTFQLFVSIAPVAILYIEPGGLVTILNGIRDSWLRIIAQRRQIVVPSLFADYDADALTRRLIPLAEPLSGAGLAALPPTQRFRLRSLVHRADDGRTRGELTEGRRENREAAAIGAASATSEGDQ